jgi:hypothetical protein
MAHFLNGEMMVNNQVRNTPPGLAHIAAGRDLITTADFALSISRARQTIRKSYCLTGSCFGIRPIKFGNRLLWPVADIAALLNGGFQ